MRNYIQFLLDGEIITERHLDPTMTVLQYLRERHMLTGTKEGCAEGDCGACTIVLSERVAGEISSRSVNACILFMGTLDGKELRTVESIGTPDAPHEIQTLVAEKHGSQCGFCTPGIVMSLYALQADGVDTNRKNIDEALAGNLCRCTGYGPIIDAAMAMKSTYEASNSEQLRGLQHDELIEFSAKINGVEKRFYVPKTKSQMTKLLGERPNAVILAGGTDVGLWVTKQHRVLSEIIYIGQVDALKLCEQKQSRLIFGAGTTYTDAVQLIEKHYPNLAKLIARIGGKQVRNLGTLCGNIANGSPIGDMPPLLIVLSTMLEIVRDGETRLLDLEKFFIDYGKQDIEPGEMIVNVSIPIPKPGQKFFAYKISKRFESDISAVCMGMSLIIKNKKCEQVRIAYGGMAATPKRATAAEKMLEGKDWSEENIRRAMHALDSDFSPIDDMRASKEYRQQVAQNLILKAWLEDQAGEKLHVLEVGA